ncbi:MAG: hypothetical protein HFH69_01080 [Lachnospiraceae bacterium]|nr:hypothetical protein [Lachnospiraceae bacterium]
MVWKEHTEGRERREWMRTDRSRAEPQYSDEKEYCVLCGRLAEEVKDLPISEREYYIEGAGQLCRECYQELYVPQHNETVVQFFGHDISGSRFLQSSKIHFKDRI